MRHVWWTGKMHTGFWWGNLKEKRSRVRPPRKLVDNIKVNLKMCGRGRGLDLAHDRDRWRTVVDAVMNPPGSRKCR